MAEHVIIDGNNLLHALHTRVAASPIGRERLVRLVERWADKGDQAVTLVFDGSPPRGGLARQMESPRITVRFSAPRTADDIIVDLINAASSPRDVRVVSDDKAVGHAARYRRCRDTTATDFTRELLGEPAHDGASSQESTGAAGGPDAASSERPPSLSREETREWLETFGFNPDDEEPFEGHDAMGV